MIAGKTVLAIIPARGGSKGVLRKNIRELGGKPLIAWTIGEAKKSNYIDRIILSSEDDEIIKVAKHWGCEVPFIRPRELAQDNTPGIDPVIHAIETLQEKYDYIVLLQPTSPLRNEKHIDEAIELLELKKADAIISVCETDHSPLWCNILNEDLSMTNFLSKELLNKRSQDLPLFYRLNGAIYICETQKLLRNKSFFIKENIFAYIMDKKTSVDIDDDIDFLVAKELINLNKI